MVILERKAIKRIIPFLQEGYLENEAVLLAKLPVICNDWQNDKDKILELFDEVNKKYKIDKDASKVVNSLIEQDKAEEYEKRNPKSQEAASLYEKEITEKCKEWYKYNTQEILKQAIIFYDEYLEGKNKREAKYISDGLLKETFTNALIEKRFINEKYIKENVNKKTGEIKTDIGLYHHSDIEKYPKVENGRLSNPIIPSIKNPMFNKAMVMLKRLIQHLIDKGDIDEQTEVVVEVARELNDNNKRVAIEEYQRERESKREKYRQMIAQYKKDWSSQKVDDNIEKFEIWTEQNLEEVRDGKKVMSKNDYILKHKTAEERYELWKEQKAICFYTGKTISIAQLFSNEIEIEHTIPRSKFPCNEKWNKTVCFRDYNKNIKRNQLPTQCPNYQNIKNRLTKWEKIRDDWKEKWEKNKSPGRNETDEDTKNKRIIAKHVAKMHYDYWEKKVKTFTMTEVPDGFVRRQLTDTQMISKYARAYLKTYFNKVTVQKGEDTAYFRKIFGIQSKDKIKSRDTHTHHAVDAATLTLIPTNASKREEMLKKAGKCAEEHEKQTYHEDPFDETSNDISKTHSLIVAPIENNTLIYHHKKDNILKQTKKIVRKRGKIQYLKDKKTGEFILDEKGNKKPMVMQGDTIRGSLFNATFLGKIRIVERDEEGKVLRNDDGTFQFKKDKKDRDCYEYVVRKPVKKEVTIADIIDPKIKDLFRNASDKTEVKDSQGNIIRRVRVKTNMGGEVKERKNYTSKHDYKNKYYAQSGGIPYAIMLSKTVIKKGKEKIDRKLLTVSLDQVSKIYKEAGKFDINTFIKKYHPEEVNHWQGKQLLKKGQKVLVLKDDEEYNQKEDKYFQQKRLYSFNVFENTRIQLKYHMEANKKAKYLSGNLGKSNIRLTKNSWNFLLEGEDFEMNIDGTIKLSKK